MPTKMLNKKQIEEVFAKLSARWPHANCELKYNTPFQLLIAVVLSAQATDKSVNKALDELRKDLPNFGPHELLQLGEQGFLAYVKSIGLANTKTANCIKISRAVLEKFQGEIPRTQEELESLPGVGRKTANVVRNVIFHEPTLAVDTHVARVSQRLGIAKPTENREAIEEELLKKVPTEYLARAHHILIFHGRYLCVARNPKCEECPVQAICPKIGVAQKKPSTQDKKRKRIKH